jgi:hypothetical protein
LNFARDGFHRLDFMKGDSLQRIVLDAEQLGAATQRVQEVYGIERDLVIVSPGT